MLSGRMISSRFRLIGAAAALGLTAAGAVPAQGIEIDDIVIFATNSVEIERSGSVTGAVVVNKASAGPTLNPNGFELLLDQGGQINGDVKADSADLRKNTTVTGDVQYNQILIGNGATQGSLTTPLPLPVVQLPDFQTASIGAGAQDVGVGENQTVTLGAGEHGNITIDQGGRLQLFGGGVFNIRSITEVSSGGGQCGSADPGGPSAACRAVVFDAPSDVRLLGRFDIGKNAFIGDANGVLDGNDFVFYVGGANADPNELPAAFHTGKDSTVNASVFAPSGTIMVDQSSSLSGTLVGKDVTVAKDAVLVLNAFPFRNPPIVIAHDPIADPQTVSTEAGGGGESNCDEHPEWCDAEITASTEPEVPVEVVLPATATALGEDCRVTCAGPHNGKLTGDLPDLTYTPNVGFAGVDSFEFEDCVEGVCSNLLVAIAVVAPATPPSSIAIILTGSDPDGDSLTFSIVPGSGPTKGSLGTLMPIVPAKIEIPDDGIGNDDGVCDPAEEAASGCVQPATTSASVEYTPDTVGANEEDSFEFMVADGNGGTDTALVKINPANGTILPDVGVASGSSVRVFTVQNVAITVELPANTTAVGEDCVSRSCAGPQHGAISALDDGEVVYSPNFDFVGTDTFEYEVTVGRERAIGLATVEVLPIAPDKTAEITQEEPTSIVLTAVPGLLSFPFDEIEYEITLEPRNGTLETIFQEGSSVPTVIYTPNKGFFGTDTFEFTAAINRFEISGSGLITVLVNPFGCATLKTACFAGLRDEPEPPIILQ